MIDDAVKLAIGRHLDADYTAEIVAMLADRKKDSYQQVVDYCLIKAYCLRFQGIATVMMMMVAYNPAKSHLWLDKVTAPIMAADPEKHNNIFSNQSRKICENYVGGIILGALLAKRWLRENTTNSPEVVTKYDQKVYLTIVGVVFKAADLELTFGWNESEFYCIIYHFRISLCCSFRSS